MNFKCRSLAVLCGVLLLASCGEVDESPALPGPVQVDPSAFVSAQEYRFTPGSVLETTSMRLDFVNPRFDQGIAVRNTGTQGSGEARLTNIEASIRPIGQTGSTISDSVDGSTLAIVLPPTLPPLEITAFAPNDARLETQAFVNGINLISSTPEDQRIRVNSSFRGALVNPDLDEDVQVRTILTLRVNRILVNTTGTQVVIEGDASLQARTTNVFNTVTGETLGDDPPDTAIVTMGAGSFSASFVVRQRGIAGDGGGEDALALLARLNFQPNQAEIVYRPTQVGTQSVLFAPDPTRPNILTNQLVRIRRSLSGRVQASFDPANTSTVLNFVQVSPPPEPFPTPIPQLPPPTRPGAPTAFDYFFSLRTERSTGTLPGSPVEGDNLSPVILQGIVPTTGDFVFRSLAGAQLAGPFNRLDIGGGTQRGNFNLVFDQTTSADRISGQWFLEQEFPTGNVEAGTADEPGTPATQQGAILIIRGFFNGVQVNL
ncbi:hypothetical protein [Thermostichus vulcanus]|uniref:Uncharacterized protein n=1 Tax=Thermostichus vulcanus str. 'Rupite' TaxID=2813851 RepID=A0ABT0C7D4_THEVL|nr:hypothetical protein [Thermostichus vulcanus]MCJ2541702.1 hypothetical protein [Thermostichus vulcanus str. 'Rupite']